MRGGMDMSVFTDPYPLHGWKLSYSSCMHVCVYVSQWELWWPEFPVLVYFKEKQTKDEGQIHFFPVLFNGKELYNVMKEKCGTTMTSGRNDA